MSIEISNAETPEFNVSVTEPLSASCVFDLGYLEPALVTLKTLLPHEQHFKRIFLLFLVSEDDSNPVVPVARRVLFDALKAFQLGDKLQVLEVKNQLPKFNMHHFSNAILYKALIPEALPGEDFVLNIDAGCILGAGLPAFLEQLRIKAQESPSWAIGAYLEPAAGRLPAGLPNGSSHYPNGQLLFFHTKRYQASKISARLYEALADHYERLQLAEQELLSVVMRDDEFLQLPQPEGIYLDDLATFIYNQPLALDEERLRNCIYYKNIGGCKPWKVWNLNPNKRVYLEHRREIESVLDPDQNRFIQENRISTKDNNVLTVNLLAYERALLGECGSRP